MRAGQSLGCPGRIGLAALSAPQLGGEGQKFGTAGAAGTIRLRIDAMLHRGGGVTAAA